MTPIKKGKAYVCDLSEEEIKAYRGTGVFDERGNHITSPGRSSPNRDRSIEENLSLFSRMRKGEFSDGTRTLRAKIDMNHHNLIMRDPVMFRILHVKHHRTGTKWTIYPTYDWAHGQSDSIERISHSICAVEFRHHRPLYDWFLDQLEIFHPRQIEYPRINLTRTVLSKRHLLPIVKAGHVAGWDDPRMPTLAGIRRRGIPPEVIRDFCSSISIAERRSESEIDIRFFEHIVRENLNKTAPRVMAVIKPLKVVITNYPKEQTEMLEAINNPEDLSAGTRPVPFSREICIEQDDFMENPAPKFYRLAPGREVRLRYAYFITCNQIVKDQDGNVRELLCTYDPETKGGNSLDGRKVKATLHWISVRHAAKAEVRLYDHLFDKENPLDSPAGTNWLENIYDNSLEVINDCFVEPALCKEKIGYRCQFERIGYFCIDAESRKDCLIFNRIISLRDSWQRIKEKKSFR